MRRISRLVVLLLVALGCLAGLPRTQAAEPAAGAVSAESPSTSWEGGPFLAANPTADTDCVVKDVPFCDTFTLTIGVLTAEQPDVVVSVKADSDSDIINVAVFDAAGNKVAEANALASNHIVTVPSPAPGVYEVRTELLLGIPGSSTYSGTAVMADGDSPIDLSQECAAEDTTVVMEPDDGRVVDLDVLVLLDGVDQAYAERFFQDVARPYADLNVRVVPTFQEAVPAFTGDSTVDIIAQARSRFPGGKVPAEYDIVEVLTSKDVQLLGQYAVAGQADCLGGLEWDERSFEVSEAAIPGLSEEGVPFGPLTFDAKFAAKVTAHEMGHLLGGQHHYANCVEGIQLEEELSGDTSPCTLMANFSDVVSLKFSGLNAKIARGYALKYATANDATP